MGLDLAVEGLCWGFAPGDPAFVDIPSLTLDPGSLTALVGPSGAGKSTLLFLLAGLETPAAGRLAWGGFDLGRCPPGRRDRWRRQNLGLVFQDFQLVPGLTAVENVLLPLTFQRWSVPRADRTRALRLLEDLGVARPQARAGTLSRGEMQRTALARAVFGRPPVLLADEPTASLDEAHGRAVADLLVAYGRDEGATVVVSTHQGALRDRASRILTLAHGRLAGGAA